MFENRQESVNQLLGENIEFRRLYNKHQQLHQTVEEAENGVRAMDETTLHQLKKEKLWHKDRLSQIMSECDPSRAH